MVIQVVLLAALAAGNDKEAEDAIHRFKAGYRNPSAPARAAAVTELARVHHEKVLKQLAMLLTSDENVVREAAAKGIGGFTEHRRLASSLLQAALGPNGKEPGVVAVILEALGTVGEPSALSVLYKYLEEKDAKVVKGALAGIGSLRDASSIERIIEFMKKLEKVMASDARVDQDQRDRAKDIMPSCIKALQAITKEKWTTSKEWEIWWSRNKATFKVEPQDGKDEKKR